MAPRASRSAVDGAPSYASMFVLGFGLLLPFNVMVASLEMVKRLYPPSVPVPFLMPLCFNAPQLFVQLGMVRWGRLLPALPRAAAGFALQAVVLALMPVLAGEGLWLLLLMQVIQGCALALTESSLFGYAAAYPAVLMQAILAGEGLSAVGALVAQGGLQAADPGSDGDGTAGSPSSASPTELAYFCVSSAVMAACCVIVAGLAGRLPAGSCAVSQLVSPRTGRSVCVGSQGSVQLLSEAADGTPAAAEAALTRASMSIGSVASEEGADPLAGSVEVDFAKSRASLPSVLPGLACVCSAETRALLVWCWPSLASIFLAMAISTLAYPSLISCLVDRMSTYPALRDALLSIAGGAGPDQERGAGTAYPAGSEASAGYWSVALFLLYSCADLGGRALAGKWGAPPPDTAPEAPAGAARKDAPGAGLPANATLLEMKGRTGFLLEDRSALLVGPTPAPSSESDPTSESDPSGPSPARWRHALRVLMYCVLRLALLPIILGAARGWAGFQSSGLAGATAVAAFGMTNGHAATLAMMAGPGLAPARHREAAAFLHVLFLIAGLQAGSLLALPLAPQASDS